MARTRAEGCFRAVLKSVAVGVGTCRVGAGPDRVLDCQPVLRETRRQRPCEVVAGVARLEGRHSAALDAGAEIHLPERVGYAEIADIDGVRLVMRQDQLARQRLVRFAICVKADTAILDDRIPPAAGLCRSVQYLAAPVVCPCVQVRPAERDRDMAGGVRRVAEAPVGTGGLPCAGVCRTKKMDGAVDVYLGVGIACVVDDQSLRQRNLPRAVVDRLACHEPRAAGQVEPQETVPRERGHRADLCGVRQPVTVCVGLFGVCEGPIPLVCIGKSVPVRVEIKTEAEEARACKRVQEPGPHRRVHVIGGDGKRMGVRPGRHRERAEGSPCAIAEIRGREQVESARIGVVEEIARPGRPEGEFTVLAVDREIRDCKDIGRLRQSLRQRPRQHGLHDTRHG